MLGASSYQCPSKSNASSHLSLARVWMECWLRKASRKPFKLHRMHIVRIHTAGQVLHEGNETAFALKQVYQKWGRKCYHLHCVAQHRSCGHETRIVKQYTRNRDTVAQLSMMGECNLHNIQDLISSSNVAPKEAKHEMHCLQPHSFQPRCDPGGVPRGIRRPSTQGPGRSLHG